MVPALWMVKRIIIGELERCLLKLHTCNCVFEKFVDCKPSFLLFDRIVQHLQHTQTTPQSYHSVTFFTFQCQCLVLAPIHVCLSQLLPSPSLLSDPTHPLLPSGLMCNLQLQFVLCHLCWVTCPTTGQWFCLLPLVSEKTFCIIRGGEW